MDAVDVNRNVTLERHEYDFHRKLKPETCNGCPTIFANTVYIDTDFDGHFDKKEIYTIYKNGSGTLFKTEIRNKDQVSWHAIDFAP